MKDVPDLIEVETRACGKRRAKTSTE